MCAAKLERTGFVLRSVWPNVKHFANEQSATFAQSANESSFVRKNSSQKAEAPNAAARCQRPSGILAARKCQQPRPRLSARLPTPDLLCGTQKYRHITTATCAIASSSSSAAAALIAEQQAAYTGHHSGHAREDFPVPREDKTRCGLSIEELIQTASEKYELNKDFWGKYSDIPSMAQASEKQDILQIIDNFVLIHRKHVYLFQRLKNTVLRNLDMWSAPDFAALCHAWAQLGFLHEDLCIAMAARVTATAYTCSTQELCWLMDAYATARCSVQSVVDELTRQTVLRLDEFTPSQLCLHASSFARLNVRHESLFTSIGHRLAKAGTDGSLSARDLTLAAYSFAKLGFCFPHVFEAISRSALNVVRDFTARDLQMLTVALVRAQHRDTDLLEALSLQAQRRIAQFSSESLTLMLRSMAFFNMRDTLFTRAVAQLPRAILTFRPADVTTLLNTFATVQVHSPALFDVVTPFILEKAPMFTPSEWLGALRGYSSLGHRDPLFLSALGLHLQVSRLTLQQLCNAMVDCSRLSFSGSSAVLAEAALWKSDVEGVAFPADAAAQMYSSLLLLGHSGGSSGESEEAVRRLLRELASQLRESDLRGALSPASCVNLCYAMLLAPPVPDAEGLVSGHPADALTLAGRCAGLASAVPGEVQSLLRLVVRALKLLPWNLNAIHSAERLEAAAPTAPVAESSDMPAQYVLASVGHLAPHFGDVAVQGSAVASGTPVSSAFSEGALPAASSAATAHRGPTQGIFVACEIRDGLQAVSEALALRGIEHQLVLDADMEPHVILRQGSLGGPSSDDDSRQLVLLWGSSVHYVGDADLRLSSRLSPTARLQVAAMQAARGRGSKVIVIPHWRLPSNMPVAERGESLVQVILSEMTEKEQAAKVQRHEETILPPAIAVTRPPPGLEHCGAIALPPGLEDARWWAQPGSVSS